MNIDAGVSSLDEGLREGIRYLALVPEKILESNRLFSAPDCFEH